MVLGDVDVVFRLCFYYSFSVGETLSLGECPLLFGVFIDLFSVRRTRLFVFSPLYGFISCLFPNILFRCHLGTILYSGEMGAFE